MQATNAVCEYDSVTAGLPQHCVHALPGGQAGAATRGTMLMRSGAPDLTLACP
jgi:hypothetical protein